MRALKFYQTGSLDDLSVEEVSLPTPGPGEVLIQVKAAAINPSDIKNVQGKMHETTVPRIPGRDFAGTIVKGPDELLGQSVFGSSDIPAANVVPVDDWIDLEAVDLATGARALTNGRGADIVFDVVGGAMFEQCLAALAWRARQVAISSSPEARVSFNLVNFYHNESRLLGVDSLKLSFEETAEILRQLTPGIESGTFPPPVVGDFPP